MKTHFTQRSYQSAFTLIELLVVIAIIAILAAILFPVFAQARDKARGASCLSNTKQQALAFYMYAQDYDEKVVPLYYGDWVPCCADRGGHNNWPKLLAPYVKNKGIYTCPSFSGANWDTLKCQYDPTYGGAANVGLCRDIYDFPSVIGYGYNPYFIAPGASGVSANSDMVSLAAITAPANTLAIVETRYYPPGNPNYHADWGWYIAEPPTGDPEDNPPFPWSVWLTSRRHQDGNNCAFADGHSKYQRSDVITRHANLWMWDLSGSPKS